MARLTLLCVAAQLASCGRYGFDPRGETQMDSSGIDSSLPVDASFVGTTTSYIKASTVGAGDLFGEAVALSADGRTLAVSAFHEDSVATGINGNQADNSAIDSGAVFVFAKVGMSWTQQAYIKASNTGAGDQFGRSVALSADGNTLVVSANNEDSAATGIAGDQVSNAALDSGAVYVFTRAGTTWAQQAYIKPSNTGADDDFGTHVAVSADGNTLAVGAFFEDSVATGIGGNQADNSATNSGAVYLFTRAGIVWTQAAYVKPSNTGAGDLFGEAVALSVDGGTLAVGAPLEDSKATGIDGDQADNSLSEVGAAYVFTRGGAWAQQAYVKPSNSAGFFQFGWGVALSADGDTLAVGARIEPSASPGIDADQSDSSAGAAGAVYVFSRAGASWAQQTYIKASNPGASDFFGESVRLSSDGNTLLGAAPTEDSAALELDGNQADNTAPDSGAGYLFIRAGTTWAQRSYIKATNTDAGDNLSSVSMSGAGDVVAIGALLEDSVATGIGGDQSDNSAMNSGAVYVFE